MVTRLSIAVPFVLLSLLLAAESALAASLLPRKPSELVTLEANPTLSSCAAGNGRGFDIQFRPDGSTLNAFSIPAGQVLVITDLTFEKSGLAGGASYNGWVVTDPLFSVPLIAPTVTANAAGNAGGAVSLGQGIVVRSGTRLCFFDNANYTARIHGFLTKDK